MLNYEALIEYAKAKGMPADKTRGILREYFQTLVLKFIYRHNLSKKIYFLGGTYLRFVHQFKRFSEDLDFNGDKFSRTEFEELMKFVEVELGRENLKARITYEYRGNLLTAKITFSKEVLDAYSLIDSRGKLMIKVEIHQPAWKLKTEEAVINAFGEVFPLITMTTGYIFCEKMLALSTHRRGRHVYDLMMMLARKLPMDDYVLKVKNITIPPQEYLNELIMAIPDGELKKMAVSLRPFLFDEKESDYVERAKFYLKELMKTYAR